MSSNPEHYQTGADYPVSIPFYHQCLLLSSISALNLIYSCYLSTHLEHCRIGADYSVSILYPPSISVFKLCIRGHPLLFIFFWQQNLASAQYTVTIV